MDYLTRCLNSVYQQDYQKEIEIIIVDNHSTDGSLEYIETRQDGIKLIKNNSNRGFCYAHNQAIKASKGEYILPLNFDVFLEPNFICEMVKLMDRDPSVGTISGKLYKQVRGAKSKIIDSTGIVMEHCFMRPRGALEEDRGQYDRADALRVFGACGAAPFYRREMLEDTKCSDQFFDQDFVNYVEDVDLSWRAQLRGWKCLYNPVAIAYHERGITRKNNPQIQKEYLIYGFRNRYCSMIKNIGSGYWKKNRFKIIGRELIFIIISPAAISRVLRLKVLFLTLKIFKRMLSKRKIIQNRRSVPDDYLDNFFCYNSLNLSKKGREMLLMTARGVISKLKIKKFL